MHGETWCKGRFSRDVAIESPVEVKPLVERRDLIREVLIAIEALPVGFVLRSLHAVLTALAP